MTRTAPLLIALLLSAPQAFSQAARSQTASRQSASSPAARLVALTAPQEREALAMQFMISVAPLPNGAQVAACAEAKIRPAMRAAFADLYEANLSADETAAAIAFFSSPEGQSAVRILRETMKAVMDSARAGRHVDDDSPHYPAPVAAAIEAFKQTPAGAKFYVNDLETQREAKETIDAARDMVLTQCLQAGRKKK